MSDEVFVFPLSFAQERLWFLDRLAPGNPRYNVDVLIRLQGALDRQSLARAIDEVIRRHESLRTTLTAIDGRPYQLVSPDVQHALAVVDLRALPQADREAEAAVLAKEQALQGFDLASGPLLRCTLVQLDDHDALLFLIAHHIIADGWSMGVLLEELTTLYGAFREQRLSPLRPLALQYPDYALWQRDWLDGNVLNEQLAYWKGQLHDLPTLALPADRPRPVLSSFRGASCSCRLPAPLCDSARKLAQQEGVTLFMTLLAALKVLLARYTGESDIVVGSPIANRTRAEFENVIGCFVNTLVLRTTLAGEPTFRDVLHRVREVTLGAYAHQDVPFEKLVEELQPVRDTSRNPLFQVTFQLRTADKAPICFPNLVATFPSIPAETAKFDLSVSLWEAGNGEIRGRLEYSTDLFDADRMERLAAHYVVLLGSAVAEPSRPIFELPLLTDAERRQLLIDWNRTSAPAPCACIHESFERQAERAPAAIAVRSEDSVLTYADLNMRANRLAHRLRAAGIHREAIVAVCLDSTPNLVVALLAILKAGAAYAALDPRDPAERLAFILRDCGAAFVVTDSEVTRSLPPQSETPRIDVDDPDLAREPTSNPDVGVSTDHLAYILYTSGSTGKPKGALIEHGGLGNYIRWVNEVLLQGRDLAMPAVTRPTFDACLKQLLAPLTRGHEVWVPPRDALESPERLLETLGSRQHVAMNCVPSLWQVMLDAIEDGRARKPTGLAALLLGGESVPPALLQRTFRNFPDLECWNLYGPTEVTANAVAARLRADAPITIGRPIANLKAYVLDAHDQPVPIGVPGELVLAGPGVSRGYFNRPELTASKFVANPVDRDSGERAFRTGDMVQWRRDGTLDFLGRRDGLVKVRGFRVELGEIETALTTYPEIREAVVTVRGTEKDAELVAHVVLRDGHAATVSDWRRHLERTLPQHLIPSAFVELAALPLLPNGKIDRARLPAPSGQRPRLEASFIPARTQVERAIADVWRKVLQLDAVGVYDNFFDLGGRSLLLVRIQTGVRECLNAEISMVDLFRYPTIGALAAFLQSGRADPPRISGERHHRSDAALHAASASSQHPV